MCLQNNNNFKMNVQIDSSQDIEQTHPHEDHGLHDARETKATPFWNCDRNLNPLRPVHRAKLYDEILHSLQTDKISLRDSLHHRDVSNRSYTAGLLSLHIAYH